MRTWFETLKFGGLVHQYKDGILTFDQFKKRAVEELKLSKILVKDEEALDLIESLSFVETEEEFDDIMTDIYHIADMNGVWLGL